MRFGYKKVPSTDPVYPYFLHPLLGVKIWRGSACIPFLAILDTGATQTLLHYSIAKSLYIDYKTGKKSMTRGITGAAVPIFVHDLEIEVIGLPNSKVKSQVAFINSPNVGMLLGQWGFFEHFKATFERYNETFDIDLKP